MLGEAWVIDDDLKFAADIEALEIGEGLVRLDLSGTVFIAFDVLEEVLPVEVVDLLH